MKLTIISDLHLEFGEVPNIKTAADVLILAGDICASEDLHKHETPSASARAKMYQDFLAQCSDSYQQVIYVAGNHEFYQGKFHRGLETLKRETQRYPNMHFLENEGVHLNDTLFLGSTLWTNFNNHDPETMLACQYGMNDYHIITNDSPNGFSRLMPKDTLERHITSTQFLYNNVDYEKVVIVTHHAPSFKSCHDRFINNPLMSGAYASDLSEFILDNPQIKLWAHGHMHDLNDYNIGDTRIYSNPRGYPSQNPDWEPTTIEV